MTSADRSPAASVGTRDLGVESPDIGTVDTQISREILGAPIWVSRASILGYPEPSVRPIARCVTVACRGSRSAADQSCRRHPPRA